MKKIFAILMLCVMCFSLCACGFIGVVSEEDQAVMDRVKMNVVASPFRYEEDNPHSSIDTVYIVTFTEDVATFKITMANHNNQKSVYYEEYNYELVKSGKNYRINLKTKKREDFDVLLLSEHNWKDGEGIVYALSTVNSREYYDSTLY